MNTLATQIAGIAISLTKKQPEVSTQYIKRLETNSLLTRDENKTSHFCAYFLPYNKDTGEVFIVHHKKSGLWLSPGGHVDAGETLLETVNREIREELGVSNFFKTLPHPFFISVTPIENTIQPCKEHFDIWFMMETDGSHFNVDPQEFLATTWATLQEALALTTDAANTKVLQILSNKK